MSTIADQAENLSNSDESLITRLAGLSSLEYERARESAASHLGCRALALDKLVIEARKGIGKNEAKGRAIVLYEPEPWHLLSRSRNFDGLFGPGDHFE